MVFLAAAGLARCDVSGAVTCVVLGIGLGGLVVSGFYVAVLDVCGPFAGSVMGLMDMAGASVGIVGPYVVGVLTEDQVGIYTRVGWKVHRLTII